MLAKYSIVCYMWVKGGDYMSKKKQLIELALGVLGGIAGIAILYIIIIGLKAI